MAHYISLTTNRITFPDEIALNIAIKSVMADQSAILAFDISGVGWRGKKATVWTAQQIIDAQNLLNTIPAMTKQVAAGRIVDVWPIETRAALLSIIDGMNVIRAALAPPKVAITPAQALNAVRAKVDTLL